MNIQKNILKMKSLYNNDDIMNVSNHQIKDWISFNFNLYSKILLYYRLLFYSLKCNLEIIKYYYTRNHLIESNQSFNMIHEIIWEWPYYIEFPFHGKQRRILIYN